MALSWITIPVYIRLIGTERYGVLAIAWLLLGYFGLFDLGLGRATAFRIASLKDAPAEDRAETFWAALAVNVGLGIVAGAVLWFAAHIFFAHVFKVDERLRPEILAAAPLLALSVPVATLTGVLSGALQGREKFLQTNMVSALSTALFQVLPLGVAFLLGPNLSTLLIAALAARTLTLGVFAYQCHSEFLRGQVIRFVPAEVRELLGYGGWITVDSMLSPLLNIVDRFAIGAVLGAASVTAYTVPFLIAQRVATLPNALTSALFPRMSASDDARKRELGRLALRGLASILTLPTLIGIFLMDPFLHVWIGRQLNPLSIPVGRVILIGFWSAAFAVLCYTKAQSSGRPDLVAKTIFWEIPPYFLLLYFGMKYFGLVGSAAAFTVRCAADYVIMTWVTGRDYTGWKVLAIDLMALIAAACLTSLWGIADWRWWLTLIVLGGVVGVSSWKTMPPEMSSVLIARIRRMAPLLAGK